VTAAPLNNIDRVRADGSHYSVRSGEYASGGLPAVPGVIGAGGCPAGSGCCSAPGAAPWGSTRWLALRPPSPSPTAWTTRWQPDVITRMLAELLDLLSSGKLHIDIERVPLSAVREVWARDQQGRRPVFIP
jgi:hypothetical protein